MNLIKVTEIWIIQDIDDNCIYGLYDDKTCAFEDFFSILKQCEDYVIEGTVIKYDSKEIYKLYSVEYKQKHF